MSADAAPADAAPADAASADAAPADAASADAADAGGADAGAADAPPLVSVIMGVHNGAGHVARAVQSIREQTFGAWELIVVDDGSDDGTGEVLARLAAEDPRIRVLRHERRAGLPAALNLAAAHARGALVARQDADDVSLPDRLALQVAFMDRHPEVSVLGGGAELVDESGVATGVHLRPEGHAELVARIFRENPFIHPAVMYRRTYLEAAGGYDVALPRAQDYDLWLRTFRGARFHNLQRPLIRYTVREAPSWRAVAYGAYVLARGAARNGLRLRAGWYALRVVGAGLLARTGLRRSTLRAS